MSSKRDWQIRLAALVIFVLGAAAGALAFNVYRGVADTGERRERHRFGRVLEQLELSDEQHEQVKAIFSDARNEMQAVREECGPKFKAVREKTDARLQEVMSAEQWGKFQELTEKSRDRRHHRLGERGREPAQAGEHL